MLCPYVDFSSVHPRADARVQKSGISYLTMRCASVVIIGVAVISWSIITTAAVTPSNEESARITPRVPIEETRPDVTIGFLVLLYAVFLLEWYHRICRKTVQSCYQTLVVEKKLYLLLVSLVSHAATTSTNTPSSSSAAEHASGTRIRQLYESIWRGGSLSGLPLLVWSSHLLWKLRTLEQSSDSSLTYGRLWISLLTVSISLELLFLRYICVKRTGSMVLSSSSTLLGSLLAIDCFGVSAEEENQHWIAVAVDFGILTLLAIPFHTFGSFFGFVSGCLHRSDVTAFLAQPYWNNCLIVWILAGCCCSLKAHVMVRTGDTPPGDYLPCIDHVSSTWWNTRQQQQPRRNDDSNSSNDYDERINSVSSLDDQVIIDVEPGLIVEQNGISTAQQTDEDRNVGAQFPHLYGPRSRQRPTNV